MGMRDSEIEKSLKDLGKHDSTLDEQIKLTRRVIYIISHVQDNLSHRKQILYVTLPPVFIVLNDAF